MSCKTPYRRMLANYSERKRARRISELIDKLSTTVGASSRKPTTRATILERAIAHIKYLEMKVDLLETKFAEKAPVFVRFSTRENFLIEIEPFDTVYSVKLKIQIKTGVCRTQQCLFLDGKELTDNYLPGIYKMFKNTNNCFIDLSISNSQSSSGFNSLKQKTIR